MKSVSCRFHSDRSGSVRNDPVKLGYRKLFTERRIYQIHMRKKFSGFSKRSTCTENPWYKLELGDVVAVFSRFCINCISYKIKSCHPKTFFINTVIVQRIIARHMSHTDDGIMRNRIRCMTELEMIIPGSDNNLVSIRKFIVKSSAKIKIFCLISCCSTHNQPPFTYSFFIVTVQYPHSYLLNSYLLSKIKISIICRQEPVIDNVAAFILETVVVRILRFVQKTDQAVKFTVVHVFAENVL